MIPGFTGTHSALLEMTDQLRDKYFILLPDLPGWGDSKPLKSNLTLESYVLYLKKLLDHININKLSIFGHCMGATIALEFCYQFPKRVNKAILVSTPYLDNTIVKKFFLHLADASLKSPVILRPIFFFWRNRLFEAFINYFSIKFKSQRKKNDRLISILTAKQKHNEKVIEENWISFIHLNYGKFKNIKVPIFLIHGSDDIIVSPEQAIKLHNLIANSQLQFIKEAGHLPPIETPNTLESIVLEYLSLT